VDKAKEGHRKGHIKMCFSRTHKKKALPKAPDPGPTMCLLGEECPQVGQRNEWEVACLMVNGTEWDSNPGLHILLAWDYLPLHFLFHVGLNIPGLW
jgi:hypothetical protein